MKKYKLQEKEWYTEYSLVSTAEGGMTEAVYRILFVLSIIHLQPVLLDA
jgi:hypothetical protein